MKSVTIKRKAATASVRALYPTSENAMSEYGTELLKRQLHGKLLGSNLNAVRFVLEIVCHT